MPIHALDSAFETSLVSGLTTAQVESKILEVGPNNLGNDDKISITKILAHQVFNAMVLVLIISMAIAFGIKDWISGGVIGAVIFVNISVGFVQEFKAEKTMGSLRSLSSPTARVLRNGAEITVDAENVVPGDIVHIKVGDTVPADLRLFETTNLETDEALLTGESLPVAKDHESVYYESVPVGDRLNMAYSSSFVSKGRGVGVCVATGLNTEIGTIARSLKGSENLILVKAPPSASFFQRLGAAARTVRNVVMNILGTNVGTPLHRKLAWLAIYLFWVAVLFAIVVMASQKFKVNKNVAIYAICVALSMIPSSLVVVLTITMAIGAQVMVTKNVIVRKLDSLEALGGIDDICSDKTGTLTQGKMVAKTIFIPTIGTYTIDNVSEPFNPQTGDLSHVKYSPAFMKELDEELSGDFREVQNYRKVVFPKNTVAWMLAASLANIATVSQVENEDGVLEWTAHGDATEIAIQVLVARLGYARASLTDYTHVAEFPFDSSIKRMSAVYTKGTETVVYTKGAVERILDRCVSWHRHDETRATDSQEPVALTPDDVAYIHRNMEAMSSQGLRVLAFASRVLDKHEAEALERDVVETGLTFHGLVGIYDPPREETARSVTMCHGAGINVHMVTGDHPSTAKAIAQEVGILPHNLHHYAEDVVAAMCMTAAQFDGLTDAQIDELPVLPLVIARCAPQTKVRMIEALHRRGKFVAMTGDGVNDSPSLKRADVGIAMGLNGSDVAKDASDIILTDDNFASILNAIEEGRRMSSNIRKFVLQLMAENVAQALYLMVGLVFIDRDGFSVFPLSPVEVLWIIVVTSCFPAMGLGQEPADSDVLQLPPNSTIFTTEVLLDMFVYGVWMAACCLLCFAVIVYGVGDAFLGHNCNQKMDLACNLVGRGRSGAFAAFTWCALLLAFECCHLKRSFFNMRPESDLSWHRQLAKDLWGNQFLFWSVVGGFLSVFPVVYIPAINDLIFLHAGIGYEWGLSVLASVVFLGGCELWKWAKRRYSKARMVRNPEHELKRNDPFEKYASFSKADILEV